MNVNDQLVRHVVLFPGGLLAVTVLMHVTDSVVWSIVGCAAVGILTLRWWDRRVAALRAADSETSE